VDAKDSPRRGVGTETVSRDGRMPDNVSEADFDRAFPPDCPETCASMRSCPATCGGCACHLVPPCTHCLTHEAGDCDCPSLKEIRADRAEARADARRDDR
jgi:hypothetical protein